MIACTVLLRRSWVFCSAVMDVTSRDGLAQRWTVCRMMIARLLRPSVESKNLLSILSE
jgi:hypothetical protein